MAFESKHYELLQRYVGKFGLPNRGDEHARDWTKKLAGQFAFTFPSEGWGTKASTPNHPQSTDVIARRLDNVLVGYDLVLNATAANAVLKTHIDEMNINDQHFIPVSPVDSLSSIGHNTKLGISCFSFLRDYLDFFSELKEDIEYAKNVIGVDTIRAFAHLRDERDKEGDPWQYAGMDYKDPLFRKTLVEGSKWVYGEYGITIAWCLSGTRGIEERNEWSELVDAVVDPLLPNLNTVEYLEPWNEWVVNGAARHTLRNMARRMRGKLPDGFPIALSSPNCIMGGNPTKEEVHTEVTGMYGGDSGANLMTIHPTRPEPIWNAESDYGPDRPRLISIGEPRGPGASAGGDVSNPTILASDYLSAIRGQAILYVYHPLPGIWRGRCNPRWPAENRWKRYSQVPNADAIAEALKSVRGGGIIINNPETGGTDVGEPYPDEKTWWSEYFKEEVRERYKRAGRELDNDYPLWFARTAYDIRAGMTKEKSAEKHLKELDEVLGL